MSRTSILIDASPDAVFAVLDDACAYPAWVVGARRVRHVDAAWPAVGARFHHALGGPGAELHDSSRVLERAPPRHLRLEVRFRPAGVAEVDLTLVATAGGTRVVMEEHPRSGPAAAAPRWVVDPVLHARNLWSLRRLREEVRRRDRPTTEPAVGTLLGDRTVATAESCTGGLVAQALARETGSGDWFRGGVITYMRAIRRLRTTLAAATPRASVTVTASATEG